MKSETIYVYAISNDGDIIETTWAASEKEAKNKMDYASFLKDYPDAVVRMVDESEVEYEVPRQRPYKAHRKLV